MQVTCLQGLSHSAIWHRNEVLCLVRHLQTVPTDLRECSDAYTCTEENTAYYLTKFYLLIQTFIPSPNNLC